MKRSIVRFLLSCVLFLMIVSFLYYIWTINNTAISSVPPNAGSAKTDERKTPYTFGTVKKDLTYCSGQRMDIYHPRTAKYYKSPVVIYYHGGGWALNDKNSEPDQLALLDGLRDKGYTIVAINYRKLPQNYYPDAVRDSLCAVRFLRAKAETYGIDQKKIAAYGFSAGGYLAAMVGALPDDSSFETPEYADYSSRVTAVVTLAGIFDFDEGLNTGNQERIANFLNGADPATAEVSGYLSSEDPSFMLIHGADDQYVQVEQDNIMAAVLQRNDIAYEQIFVTNAEHGLNASGGQPLPDRATIKQRIAQFIQSKLDLN